MPDDAHYKDTVQSLETPPNDPPTLADSRVRLGDSDRLTETSDCTPSSSQQRRHHRRESDSTVALTWCVLAAVAASAIAAGAAI